ncbi:hypothetical protein JOD97_002823 [Duganella sp. 1411]|uniref:XAC2610-related protein n=1 Tax=Duganella sp. 1411 TaxID=2806572 RepID=UPI001AE0F034|nr:hypothetical protein [Duganella sp. 1411]MBP1204781.1 hypothetical protein [Duganella sp. 1411]
MLRLIMVLTVLSLCPPSARAADAWCGPHPEEVLRFKWLPKGGVESQAGSVQIEDIKNGKIIQVLDNVENYRADSESLTSRDFDNDGCGDLVVTSAVAAIGNETSSVFLYDRTRRRFVFNKQLSDIGGIDIDPRNPNCVTGSWKGGADDMYAATHCWRKGKLVLQNEYSQTTRLDEEGNVACYEKIETTYVRGQKKIRKRCTKDSD